MSKIYVHICNIYVHIFIDIGIYLHICNMIIYLISSDLYTYLHTYIYVYVCARACVCGPLLFPPRINGSVHDALPVWRIFHSSVFQDHS